MLEFDLSFIGDANIFSFMNKRSIGDGGQNKTEV